MNPRNAQSSDEISLVDLAVLLVRRWKLMLAIFVLVLLAAVAFLLLRPASYTYTSLYSVAEYQNDKGERVSLEKPAAVLTKVRTLILPTEIRAYLGEGGWSQLPFNVESSNPQGTELIALTTQASEDQLEAVEALHRQVLEATAQSQLALVERTREGLELRLEGIRSAVQEVGVAGGVLFEQASELESRLAALGEGDIAQVASRSLEPQGIGSGLILVLGIMLGLVLAIVGAFAWHFVTLVRASLTQD